jgi:hypothetical protein
MDLTITRHGHQHGVHATGRVHGAEEEVAQMCVNPMEAVFEKSED